MHGTFIWNELMTRDVEGAKAFFAETLGWTYDAMPIPQGGTYWLAKIAEKGVAGLVDMSDMPGMEGVPPHWFAYIAVDDVDARTDHAVRLGAEMMRPSFDIPNVGRIAILRDPTGAAIGWMTSETPMQG